MKKYIILSVACMIACVSFLRNDLFTNNNESISKNDIKLLNGALAETFYWGGTSWNIDAEHWVFLIGVLRK